MPGPQTEALARQARESGVVLVMGVNERCGNTLYNSLLTFDADGALRNHHRKLRPTFTERLVWGPGDGAGLRAPQTSVGRVGALVCWEHWMPLPRQTLHDAGEQIHVAAWPTVRDIHQVASRHYAFEGRCFVLAAGSILRVSDLPPQLATLPELAPDDLLLRGGSAIYAPDGAALAGPCFGGRDHPARAAGLHADRAREHDPGRQRPLRPPGRLHAQREPQPPRMRPG